MEDLTAQITHCPHPVLAAAERTIRRQIVLPGETLVRFLGRCGINTDSVPSIVAVNGVTVSDLTRLVRPDDLITVRTIMQGGGDSDPLQIVLSLAVLAVAAWIAGPAGVAILGEGLAAVAGGVVAVGGTMLVSALVPNRRPDITAQQDSTSPTYNLSGARNRMRPYQPMPLAYGTHKFVPDLGIQPYTEFSAEDQYLHMVFNFGLSNLIVSSLKIGETPIGNYRDVELEWSDSAGKLKRFPGNVDTLAINAVLDNATGYITRTGSENTTRIAVDIVGSLYHIGDSASELHTVRFGGQYREVGTTPWLPLFYGSEVVRYTHYWSAGYQNYVDDPFGGAGGYEFIQVDYGSTTYADHTENEVHSILTLPDYEGMPEYIYARWKWRAFADQGDDPGPFPATTVPTTYLTFTNDNTKPVRRSYARYVSKGQYEVRLWRYSQAEIDDRYISDFTWTVLKSYQPDTTDYTGQTRLGMRIRASDQISGVVDTLSGIIESRVPARNSDGTWGLTRTRNPAWQYVAHAIGKKDANGRRMFGACLPRARMDWESIHDWAGYCTANSLTCDIVFDRQQPIAEQLQIIAQCGRAAPTWATGKLGVIWDAAYQPSTAMYGMSNIIAGTFSVRYISEALADEIEVSYLDRDNNYKPTTLRATVPEVTQQGNVAKIEMIGVTDSALVAKNANLLAADQYYRRRRVTWETDMEGIVSVRGDVVTLSHDLTSWGYSGRLIAGATINGVSTVTLDRAVPLTSGTEHWLMLRTPAGTMAHYSAGTPAASGETSTLRLLTNPPLLPGQDGQHTAYDYVWFFEPSTTPGKKVKILDVRPINEHRIQFTATDEVDEYYESETNPTWTPAASEYYGPSPSVASISVSEILLTHTGISQVWLYFDLENAIGVRLRISVNGGAWRNEGEVRGNEWFGNFNADDELVIEASPWAVAVTAAADTVKTLTYTVLGKLAPPADVTGFSAEVWNQNIRLKWDANPDIDIDSYIVRIGSGNWEDATAIGTTKGLELVYKQLSLGTHTFQIKALDTSGKVSGNATLAVVIVEGPRAPDVTSRIIDNNVLLFFSFWPGSYLVTGYEVRRGADYNNPDETLRGQGTFATFFLAESGVYTFWVTGIDSFGNVGSVKSLTATVDEPPDYVLIQKWDTSWGGTLTNVAEDSDDLVACINTTETVQDHYDNNVWESPNDQVNAGYTHYPMPTPNSGSYSEEYDYGSVIGGTTIRLDVRTEQIVGSTAMTPTISYKKLVGDSWTDFTAGETSGYASDFRYIKIALDFVGADGDDIMRVKPFNVRLDIKKRYDGGVATCDSGDSGGTTVNFIRAFSDVEAITATPRGTTASRFAVVDFEDVPNPASFKILLFDNDGTRVSGDASWQAEGY